MNRRLPGIFAILVMALAMFLAHGVPGSAEQQAPAEMYTRDEIERILEADTHVTIITDSVTTEAAPPPVRRTAAGTPISESPDKRREPYRVDFKQVAYRYAVEAGIRSPKLFVRQMAAESGFQPCARSGAGALGIAQIMPATARSWKVDPHDPFAALKVAARHMAVYERQYGSYRLALAAYNAGPGAVASYGGVPPYAETREYIRRIMDRSYPLAGMRQVYVVPGGLTTEFRKRFYALQKDVARHGGRIYINSGHRTYQEQVAIWNDAKRKHGGWGNAKKWAAPPGCSNHNRGTAADLGGNLALAHRLAPRHGLVFPMSWEPWHIEQAGISSQSG